MRCNCVTIATFPLSTFTDTEFCATTTSGVASCVRAEVLLAQYPASDDD